MAKKKPNKSNKNWLKEVFSQKMTIYFENITTLHGTNYFSMQKGVKLALWAMLMVLHVMATISFLIIIKDRYKSDQIITKIYSDWSVDQTPFPAVLICNFNRVSKNETVNIANILSDHNVSKKEIESFFGDLPYLIHFEHGAEKVDPHNRIMGILTHHYYNMEIIMEEMTQKCENLILYCVFNNKEKNCNDIFKMILTLDGHCCAFNYDSHDLDNEDPMMSEDGDFDYYYDVDELTGNSVRTGIIATSQSGSSSGLRVVFNVDPSDYADWAPVRAYGAKIMLNDPNDFPETRVVYKYVTIGESLDIKVIPRIFQSEQSLRSVDPAKRGCWFHEEASLMHTSRYSYETCNTECRIQSYLAFCGCVPFKYPLGDKNTRICMLADLPCLHYMKGHWSTTKKPCIPECFKECRDKDYSVVTDLVPFLSDHYPEHATKGHNISELIAVHVYYTKSTCDCYMMSLLMDFNYFIATYGGVFSLCFGASVLTILELLYLVLASLVKTVISKIPSNRLKDFKIN